jgi:DNA-cytosine methyltransferase|tara:strand:- start:76 stop:981 length:906 start_codon:yes stop_codon:yes gene_type:complete
MNVLSLFDGMSCGRIALERAGIKVDKYYSSEIKEYAIKVANENYPQDKDYRLGDVTKIKANELSQIDLLIGGSPCQDFSGANKERLGIKGTKSGLFYEYVRLLNECKPKYFLLENVRMKKEHQDLISKEIGYEPIVINSELVSPHLRHRLYWTNIPNVKKIKNTELQLNNFLEKGYSDRKKARTLLESDSRPLSTPIKMAHRYFNTGFTTLIFKDKEHFNNIKIHFDLNFKGKSAKEIDVLIKSIDLSLYNGLRYMNNREREYCQTIPKGYTDSLTQNEAACLLGDGWTVEVIKYILKEML